MIGAIAGDIIGSVYEHAPIKTKAFQLFHPHCRFTDDTVLTVAIAEAILSQRPYLDSVREIGRRHPNAGYGGMFINWLLSPDPKPYNSWGNGAAMRVSPVGFAFADEDEVLRQAEATASITHNHPEGIKGAQATALTVFLARTERDKGRLKSRLMQCFAYDLERSLVEIRPTYSFDVSCQGTVPEAIIAVLESSSYEDAIRNAVSLGGDSDTLACIAGGMAEALYGGVPGAITAQVQRLLPPDLWRVVEAFERKYAAGFQ